MATFTRNPRFRQAIDQVAAPRLRRAADAVTAQMRTLIEAPGTGPDGASMPGEPPASQSGRLAAAHRTFGPIVRGRELVAASGVAMASQRDDPGMIAKWLQLGTATIAPRPYMALALRLARPKITKAMGGDL